jgi:hypothetical protein
MLAGYVKPPMEAEVEGRLAEFVEMRKTALGR